MNDKYGKRIDPFPIEPEITVSELIDNHFTAYNAARIREACQIYATKLSQRDVTVCLTLSGALTPAGLGANSIMPLIEDGLVDWIISTGANLYHDLHYALKMSIYQSGRPGHQHNDIKLRDNKIIRLYDLLFDYDVLLDTDQWITELLKKEAAFHKTMSSAEFHHLVGKYVNELEQTEDTTSKSLLGAAYRNNVPIFTGAPGDSTFGMNIASLELAGGNIQISTNQDVNESSSIVYHAKKIESGKSAVVIMGGGTSKNFALQTEPYIQEILQFEEAGHDYFIQFTDARPDTGGLSGATPGEAVSWGKVDPLKLPDSVVAYTDSTIVLPLLTAYLRDKGIKKRKKELYLKRDSMLSRFKADYLNSQKKTTS